MRASCQCLRLARFQVVGFYIRFIVIRMVRAPLHLRGQARRPTAFALLI